MQRLRVLRKICRYAVTDEDILFIRLHVNVGDPVMVSYHDYDAAFFDKHLVYSLTDIDLKPSQSLDKTDILDRGFRGVGKKNNHYDYCYVLEEEIGNGEWIMPPPPPEYKPVGLNPKEDNNMEVMNGNFMQQMIGMKMLKSVFDSDAKDINIGKLIMMQQVLGGSAIQVTDVIKAKIMEQFALDDKNVDDLPLDKLLLLQMLDKGSIDIQQLIQFKMMSKMLEEDL